MSANDNISINLILSALNKILENRNLAVNGNKGMIHPYDVYIVT